MNYSVVDPSNNVILDYAAGYSAENIIPIKLTNINGKNGLLSHIGCYIYKNDGSNQINLLNIHTTDLRPISSNNNDYGYMFDIPVSSNSAKPDTIIAKCFYSSYRDSSGVWHPPTESIMSPPILMYNPPQTPTLFSATVNNNNELLIYANLPDNPSIKYNAYISATDGLDNTSFFNVEDLSYTVEYEPSIDSSFALVTVPSEYIIPFPDRVFNVSLQEVTVQGSTSNLSNTVTAIKAPNAPSYLDISGNSNDLLVNLTWPASTMQTASPVTYYQIYRSVDSSTNFMPLQQVDNSSDISFNYTDSSNIQINTSYYYAVSAVYDEEGTLYESNLTYSTPASVFIYQTAAPTNLSANLYPAYDIDVSLNPAVELNWTNDNTNVDVSYNIVYKYTIDTSSNPQQINVYDSSYVDTNVSIDTVYYYYVTSVGVSGSESEPSNNVSQTVPLIDPVTFNDPSYIINSDGTAHIFWNTPLNYVTSENVPENDKAYLVNYNIQYATSGVLTVSNVDVSFTTMDLSSGVYTFNIKSMGLQSTHSDASLSFFIPTPTIPTSLSGGVIAGYIDPSSLSIVPEIVPAIKITWDAPIETLNIAYYKVIRFDSSGNKTIFTTNTTSFIDDTVLINNMYTYHIQTVAVNGSSSQYSQPTGYIPVEQIQPVYITDIYNNYNNGNVTLSWADASNTILDTSTNITGGAYLSSYSITCIDLSNNKSITINDISSNLTSYTLTDLLDLPTNYSFYITSYGLQSTTAESNTITKYVVTASSIPLNLSVTNPTTQSVNITFNNPSNLGGGEGVNFTVNLYDYISGDLIAYNDNIAYNSSASLYDCSFGRLIKNSQYVIRVYLTTVYEGVSIIGNTAIYTTRTAGFPPNISSIVIDDTGTIGITVYTNYIDFYGNPVSIGLDVNEQSMTMTPAISDLYPYPIYPVVYPDYNVNYLRSIHYDGTNEHACGNQYTLTTKLYDVDKNTIPRHYIVGVTVSTSNPNNLIGFSSADFTSTG